MKRGGEAAGPRAVVREIDGELVLDDPQALAMIRAVAKHNCRILFEANTDRIAHFLRRMGELRRDWRDVVIVIVNADDPNGAELAEALMPGTDWQPFRDRKEIPIARGLAARGGIEDALRLFDEEAAAKLHDLWGAAVVVVDQSVAEVFEP